MAENHVYAQPRRSVRRNVARLATVVLLSGSAAVWTGACTAVHGDVVTRRFVPSVVRVAPSDPATKGAGRETVDTQAGNALTLDLADLPDGARIYRADLVLGRRGPLLGNDDDARVKVEVNPLWSPSAQQAASSGKPLALRGPWFDRLDATEAVQRWAGAGKTGRLLVKACPQWVPERTYLDVMHEGPAKNLPPTVKSLKVVHRAGLTFITWQELEDPLGSRSPTLDQLKMALAKMEATREVRYRIYRHVRPIDKRSIAAAELLAEVGPLSAYNTRGVSTDHVIHQRQARALEDAAYARSIASEPFKISPESPEMGAVPVRRLAIEDGKPLGAGRGLYVHQPEKAGPAYYAVVTSIDGVANMVDLDIGSSLLEPVSEMVGPGEPVLQNLEVLKVFYDYPGERRHFVQWCSPVKGEKGPLANLPNQYYNWSVYVPPGAANQSPLALGIFFHDWRGLYLRPRWTHKPDQILIATNDAPWPSFGYGYHESLGTLKSFSEGVVRDFTAGRIDAFVAWVRKTFSIDAGRFSCHGMGTLGGTAAVHYALRHADQVAWVVAGYFDPDPGTCPASVESGERTLKTHLAQMEAVWGQRAWDVKNAAGVSIWKDRDLTSLVRNNPNLRLPFFAIGAGTLSPAWRQQVPFMKALLDTRQPLVADFDWGGSPPRYAPDYVRRDRLMPAVLPERMEFATRDIWTDAKVHYSSGGSINTNLHWAPERVVDTPDCLQVEGQFHGAVTFRNVQQFKAAPGEKLRWILHTGPHDKERTGEVTADDRGLVTIPGMRDGKLTVTRADAKPSPLEQ